MIVLLLNVILLYIWSGAIKHEIHMVVFSCLLINQWIKIYKVVRPTNMEFV